VVNEIVLFMVLNNSDLYLLHTCAQNVSLDGTYYIFKNSPKIGTTTELLHYFANGYKHLKGVVSSGLDTSKYCFSYQFMSDYNLQAWPDSNLSYNVSFQMYPRVFTGLFIQEKLVCDTPTF